MIDVHSHVIPGVDDGSRTMEESIQMLRSLAEQGFTGVIATPHDSRRRPLADLDERVQDLEGEIRRFCPDFSVWPGQETHYHEGLVERLKRGEAHPLNHTRYVLVEFDPGVAAKQLLLGVRRLSEAGYWPLLAHMERYMCLKDDECLRDAAGYGCFFQMNYDSLTGRWYSREVRRCRNLVRNGWIHVLGTDMHRMDWRPPVTQKALEWLNNSLDPDAVRLMTEENPRRLISGERLVRR
ncbi:MAG: protein tyrosine phosphatase [Clostridiales bacterium]|nr:protein tyrosine phosphatase [Clostridiales bacterium]